ncbi:hypothetical protein HDU93_001083 [Gonapodya sp. JEL0774]|nr:hypothetical protein HDU93_001083 [Gonapodya sp. JEL0774]
MELLPSTVPEPPPAAPPESTQTPDRSLPSAPVIVSGPLPPTPPTPSSSATVLSVPSSPLDSQFPTPPSAIVTPISPPPSALVVPVSPPPSAGLPLAAIIGLIIGGTVLLVASAGVYLFLTRRSRSTSKYRSRPFRGTRRMPVRETSEYETENVYQHPLANVHKPLLSDDGHAARGLTPTTLPSIMVHPPLETGDSSINAAQTENDEIENDDADAYDSEEDLIQKYASPRVSKQTGKRTVWRDMSDVFGKLLNSPDQGVEPDSEVSRGETGSWTTRSTTTSKEHYRDQPSPPYEVIASSHLTRHQSFRAAIEGDDE